MSEESMVEQEALVLVGRKPTAVYLARTIMLLASKGEARIMARGKFIIKAITVAVRAMKASDCDCEVSIDEELIRAGGRDLLVPRIEIALVKRSTAQAT